jgi:hypothetical protein
MAKVYAQVYVRTVYLCKIQQNDVKPNVQQVMLSPRLAIVLLNASEILKPMDIRGFAFINATLLQVQM